MIRRRDRSFDSSHDRDLDRRYGSSWRDSVYPKTGPSHIRDSKEGTRDSFLILDNTYTKTDHTHTHREIPVINALSPNAKTIATYRGEIPVVKETPVDSASIQTDLQLKKDCLTSPVGKVVTLQADRVIPVIKETPEDSAHTQCDASEAKKDSCTSSHAYKTNLEIPLMREAAKAPYSVNRETEIKRESAFVETDTIQRKRDSADSGAPEHETEKCRPVKVLKEDSPEGVSVPIIRTDQPSLGTRGNRKEELEKVQKLSPGDKDS